jgi:hypothetical protein
VSERQLETADAPAAASRLLRAAAFLLDAMLAVSVALLARLGVQLGILPGFGAWHRGLEAPWVDAQLVVLALVLAAARDVPWGASVSKWLLCLRLAGPDGRRLGLPVRLLRAPFSVLPFGWLSSDVQRRLPWRVVGYAPGPRGLVARTLLTGVAAAASIGWAIETVRPSIGDGEAGRLARRLVEGDPLMRRQLGEPLHYRVVRVTPRAQQPGRGRRASFEMHVRGARLQQSMVVHVRRIEGAWMVDEVLDIDITEAGPEGRGPVAAR